MSLLKIIRAQLGLSVTPANNFSFDASADNGTMLLERGNGQHIMTIDAAGKVAFPQNAQTWQDVHTTRFIGANLGDYVYTNTTNQTISIAASVVTNIAHITLVASINGNSLAIIGSAATIIGNRASIYFQVPAGSTYTIAAGGTLTLPTWLELR